MALYTLRQQPPCRANGRLQHRLTGLPRATGTVAQSRVRLLVIHREPFMERVEASPVMRAHHEAPWQR